ncbi:hypothetical protein FOQG_16824 [Fusarium oxysporum f. sp. raphani 54005]|uniref:Uncharacterized protein n=1 Tax=Fusarium oxysporum f. sp. raphani 54005 TaxID=1089458 RepID=X0C6Z7_FUSOX|nr:hypothetical protein FOWG_18084 [Fusarium oxysporum f. sp. lycopersici MN25]EXK78507.1 hypothetical protein FOQG_16824 [Fusarium oxysporum f. sp. raphani 54005]
MVRLCLTRRCGICHFDFCENDAIIAVRPDGKESKQFKYRSDAEINDSIGLIWCNACPIPCVHQRDQAVGCHRVCRNILTPSPLAEFLQTAAYSCEPTFNQERERRMWLLKTIESRLKLFGTLAGELRREIAQYLLQDDAARTNILGLTCKKPFQSSFTVRAPFRGNYVTYEGEVYFRSLINEPQRTDDWLAPLAVYVAEDHRGVKRLIWSRYEEPPTVSCIPGVFWKGLPIRNSEGLMEFYTNGLLLRYLSCRDSYHEYSTRTLDSFAIPRHPFKPSRSVNFHGMTDKAPRRMSIFQYNRPEITGFSVCCNPAPITLYTHTRGDDLSFYYSTPANSSWIYVPLEHKEYITSIWIRHPKPLKKMLALAFETDKGHLYLLGAQATPALSNCNWELLDISKGEPGHFFFDSHPSAMRGLIFDSKAPRQPRVLDAPKPVSPHPGLHVCEDFHWSQASLENVVAVTPCCRVTKGSPEFIGLLLDYSDGSRACVGQVRLDCLSPPLTIKSSPRLWFGFELNDENRPYIARIEISDAHLDKKMTMWFEVFLSGIIEWWYSYRQCQIWQGGRRSLATRS